MNIQAEKTHLAKLLLETENPKLLESIKKIFRKDKTADFWDDLILSKKRKLTMLYWKLKMVK